MLCGDYHLESSSQPFLEPSEPPKVVYQKHGFEVDLDISQSKYHIEEKS